MSDQFAAATWEEVASDMPRTIPDTDRLMVIELPNVEKKFHRARFDKPEKESGAN
jgi:hypothetical protein